MKPELIESQRAVSNTGRATRYLIALSVALMLALGGAFTHLANRQDTLQDSIREDALWAVYQLDRETRSLLLSVNRLGVKPAISASDVKALTLRYDILYSRLSILDNTKYAGYFEASESFRSARSTVRASVIAMEPLFNRIMASGRISQAELLSIDEQLVGLLQITEQYLTYTNAAVSAARADARKEVMQLQHRTAMVVLALGITIGLLILNLMRQVRLVKRASAQLEAIALELTEAYEAAEVGNRAKSNFMATMSHEIRTPLNAILGMAEVLSQSRLAPADLESTRIITRSGQQLLEIINEILDFAKLEHGDFEAENVPFDAAEILRDVAFVMEGRAAEQNNSLETSIGNLSGDGWYLGDPTRLRRVLLNLVSNAIKFTENGLVRVSITEKRGGEALMFHITDSGIGIPKEAQHRLFSPFNQVDGTISRRFGGTGLGLAICKKVVEGLGGKIGVDSAVGVGSCFWFEVPIKATTAPVAVKAELGPRAAPLPSLDILVVEDNAVNRQVAEKFLLRLGQRVTLAIDGNEGVRLAADHPYDLILMDMQMPVLDGIQATRAIRATGNTVPIVALTANASDADLNRCREAGMDGFEAKPISMKRMEAMLSERVFAEAPSAVVPAVEQAEVVKTRPVPANAAQPPANSAPRVNDLIEAIGREAFDGLVDTFFADAGALLTDLHQAMATGDRDLADRTLHSLKGASATLGFSALAELAETSRHGPLDSAVADRIAVEVARADQRTVEKAA